MKKSILAGCVLLSGLAASSQAGILSPMSTFGGGDGFIAPGDLAYLATDGSARGLAYNPVSGNVYVVSLTGGNRVAILSGTTGADLGQLNLTGVTGGTRALNMVSTGTDGAIYVNNLTIQSTTSAYKVYRWTNEAALAPTVAYTGDSGLPGARIGDDMDAIGGGASTRLVAGYSTSPAVTGNNGYSVNSTGDGLTYSATAVGFVGTPPAAGDHRLGITFTDSDSVIGSQSGTTFRLSDFSGSSGTLVGTLAGLLTNQRAMDYTVLNGTPILAVLDTGASSNPASTATVYIYDMTTPLAPALLASNRIPLTTNANGNATGAIAFGAFSGNVISVYAMASNNGVQAFEFDLIPEPGTFSLLSIGAMTLLARRRA
jgi:hypothetical protein